MIECDGTAPDDAYTELCLIISLDDSPCAKASKAIADSLTSYCMWSAVGKIHHDIVVKARIQRVVVILKPGPDDLLDEKDDGLFFVHRERGTSRR